jgi:hypothetical protein
MSITLVTDKYWRFDILRDKYSIFKFKGGKYSNWNMLGIPILSKINL